LLTGMLAVAFFRLRPRTRESHETSQLFTIEEFSVLAKKAGLFIEAVIPLDVLSPIWLRFMPEAVAKALFPTLYLIELAIWKVIPPGRLLLQMTKILGHLDGKQR